ncbi:plasmid replication protein RepC [Sinorhizobium medicae]|uniref:plasmid replication protein RepC n=1 Tax=Sinorhizobium medicae TaxID=110321 RepID=UPI001AAE3C16|nr:plasmid replication protein RepC [Sinorhizobium medicae]MBO1961603.1 replication initiation protein RepC [Sinorhizobium medicae]WQP42058.1 plasmid replication protein RepC [Sinorhizobium medicae]
MERGSVTTPFGRRAMTLGMLASQIAAGDVPPDRSVDKWKLFRSLCEAKTVIGVSDRSLAVLNALLSFYPGSELTGESGLVVFPSNAQLSLRTHGMAGTTLRRHLACLVEAGLILRRDSPNGKRYARRGRSGSVGEAFGFDLSPLVVRANEFSTAAAELAAARQSLRLMRERLSLCRRDAAKLLELLRESSTSVDWEQQQLRYEELATPLSRKASANDVEAVYNAMSKLRSDLANQLEKLLNSAKLDANDRHNGRHIQNSEPDSKFESEPGLGTGRDTFSTNPSTYRIDGTACRPNPSGISALTADKPRARLLPPPPTISQHAPQVPLPVLLSACTQIADYGPQGRIATWRDLMSAAVVVRTMLGVSTDAYDDACSVLGPENAATVVSCMLERADRISSPGGYLRDLTARARRQAFSLGPMVGALSRARMTVGTVLAS